MLRHERSQHHHGSGHILKYSCFNVLGCVCSTVVRVYIRVMGGCTRITSIMRVLVVVHTCTGTCNKNTCKLKEALSSGAFRDMFCYNLPDGRVNEYQFILT